MTETDRELRVIARYGDTSREAVAYRLRLAHATTGLTKTGLAKEAGVGLSTYLNGEAGLTYPSRKILVILHRRHGLDFNFMLHGDVEGLDEATRSGLRAATETAARGPDRTRD